MIYFRGFIPFFVSFRENRSIIDGFMVKLIRKSGDCMDDELIVICNQIFKNIISQICFYIQKNG